MALAPATATSSAARAASFRQRCHREKVVGEGENFTPHQFNIDTKKLGPFFLGGLIFSKSPFWACYF